MTIQGKILVSVIGIGIGCFIMRFFLSYKQLLGSAVITAILLFILNKYGYWDKF